MSTPPLNMAAADEGTRTLPQRVAERLATLGLSARAASLQAGLGVDAVRTILKGRSKSPAYGSLKALAKVLRCDVRYLTGERDDPGLAQSEASALLASSVPLLKIQNGLWMPEEEALSRLAYDLSPALQAAEVMDAHHLGESFFAELWTALVQGPMTTTIVPLGAVVDMLPAVSLPEPGQHIFLLERKRSGFIQRGMWRGAVLDDGSMKVSNEAAEASERQLLKLTRNGGEFSFTVDGNVQEGARETVSLLGVATRATIDLRNASA